MANFIPEAKILEIKNTADIVDVVSEVVLLKKAGNNYVGLCPFHAEKTPSFTVSPVKQIFHCFGCGEGGGVFNFVMKHDGLSFPEAVRVLARRYSIDVPRRSLSPAERQIISEKEKLLDVNRQAMQFFRQQLLETRTGNKALEYLYNRKIQKMILDDFAVGYAPAGWERLLNFFKSQRVPLNLAEKSGLIIVRKSHSGHYDRFRDRIIFPIFNLGGNVIGFGGRVLDDTLPKYLNSPDSPVYNKSRSLYGIERAKRKCRETETVVVVEGYFDLMALHQHQIQNTVATLGTSLTPEHVRMLKGFVGQNGKVILVFDSDSAGVKAAQRSIEVFVKAYVDAQILVLPENHDPDSYIFEFGAAAFREAIQSASSMMSFLIESAIRKHGLSVEGKIHVISDLSEPLALIGDQMESALYIKALAERIEVEEQSLIEKVRTTSGRLKSKAALTSQGISLTEKGREDPTRVPRSGKKLEMQIISMMLQFQDILPEIRNREIMHYFEDEVLKSIGESLLQRKGPTADMLTETNDKDKRRIIASLAIGEDVWDYEGCLRLLSQYEASKYRRDNSLLKRIKAAEENEDQELLKQLLLEKQKQARKNPFQRPD